MSAGGTGTGFKKLERPQASLASGKNSKLTSFSSSREGGGERGKATDLLNPILRIWQGAQPPS